jgi:hypothetical protein
MLMIGTQVMLQKGFLALEAVHPKQAVVPNEWKRLHTAAHLVALACHFM